MDMKERETQYCSPEELIPYEKNPRDNRLAIDDVVRSIEEYGFTNPRMLFNNVVLPIPFAPTSAIFSPRSILIFNGLDNGSS